jgi:hypothetical protein
MGAPTAISASFLELHCAHKAGPSDVKYEDCIKLSRRQAGIPGGGSTHQQIADSGQL